jgi:hypothetical protein
MSIDYIKGTSLCIIKAFEWLHALKPSFAFLFQSSSSSFSYLGHPLPSDFCRMFLQLPAPLVAVEARATQTVESSRNLVVIMVAVP